MGDHSPESRLYGFDVPPVTPAMIIDGSYGDAEMRLDEQRHAIAKLAAKGPVLLPVPADGRGPDIAIFLRESGFEVAIDDAVRTVAEMLLQEGRESVRPESIRALQRLVKEGAPLRTRPHPRGVMVAHRGWGDVGVAAAVIKRWRDARTPPTVFPGHLAAGTPG